MPDTYEVYWGSPGNKTISFKTTSTSNSPSIEVFNHSVSVSINSNVCDNSTIIVDLCDSGNPCTTNSNTTLTEPLICSLFGENVEVQINFDNLQGSDGPYYFGIGSSNGIQVSSSGQNNQSSSHESFNVHMNSYFLGNAYVFVRDSNGCSKFLRELEDCPSCNSGMVLFPKDDYWISAFDCDGGADGVIDLDFEVACGIPPYTLSFNPPINLVENEFTTNFINAEIPSDVNIDMNTVYSMTVTDANGNTVSQDIECDMFGGTGPGGGTLASNNCPTPSPVFNSITSYNYCVSDNNFCIDYNVSDSGDIYAVYVRNFPDKLVLFNNNTVPNAQGQFCFELDELSIGSNVVDVVAYGSGCLSDFTTQQYTININDYNYLPHI